MPECIQSYYLENDTIQSLNNFNSNHVFDGISAYEVIRIIQGVPLFLEDHIQRLHNTIQLSHIQQSISLDKIRFQINILCKKNNCTEGNVKYVVNINSKEKNDYHILCYFIPHYYPEKEVYKKGIKTVTFHGMRDNPHAKIVNRSLREQVEQIKQESKSFEVLLVDQNNSITEGSKSNVFFIKGETLISPPEKDVLQGISRKYCIELARSNKIKYIEKEVSKKDLHEFDSVFITGTSIKFLPIRQIDAHTYKTDNKIVSLLQTYYEDFIGSYINLNSKT